MCVGAMKKTTTTNLQSANASLRGTNRRMIYVKSQIFNL